MTTPALTLKDVSKRFRKVHALKDVSLNIRPSEITGILGPDGAGKSTLLKICAGILSYSGDVHYMDTDLRRDTEAMKDIISFMPQGIGQNLYMELTVEENIDFFASLKDVSPDKLKGRKERLLEGTGLKPFRDRLARNLSGGMKQKLGICCSLISTPELLILDEPSTGIDPLSRRELWELLNEFVTETGTTVILGTSYMDEAERCHYISFLDIGRVVFSGYPEELIEGTGGLEEAFFNLLTNGRDSFSFSFNIPFSRETTHGPDKAISVEGVSKSFGSFRAIDDINLSIKEGEVFGLLGPNGAGKTTLIKCITGLLTPDKGLISLSGLSPSNPEVRRKIGYMSQIFSLYNDLTVKENIELYGAMYGIRGADLRRRMDWVIEISSLQGLEGRAVKGIPLGMKQRLALGCAVINFPSILFLDEPTSGVDPVARKSFWLFIRELSRRLGMTVLVTTHNLVEADFCDMLGIMNEGRLIALNTPKALREGFTSENGYVFEVYPEAGVDTAIFSSSHISATPYGRRFHLWRKGLTEEELNEIFQSHDLRYRYIRRIRPSMEDVFIHYLKHYSMVG